jgi:hypothetical protein
VHLLYFWRGDNYRRDLDHGVGFHLNQANPLLHQIGIGESLWAFTRKRDGRPTVAREGRNDEGCASVNANNVGRGLLGISPEDISAAYGGRTLTDVLRGGLRTHAEGWTTNPWHLKFDGGWDSGDRKR